MVDEWGGLADLLANLIAKYASVLDVENMSDEARKIELTDREKVEFE